MTITIPETETELFLFLEENLQKETPCDEHPQTSATWIMRHGSACRHFFCTECRQRMIEYIEHGQNLDGYTVHYQCTTSAEDFKPEDITWEAIK